MNERRGIRYGTIRTRRPCARLLRFYLQLEQAADSRQDFGPDADFRSPEIPHVPDKAQLALAGSRRPTAAQVGHLGPMAARHGGRVARPVLLLVALTHAAAGTITWWGWRAAWMMG